jgi:CheY-like chemotaxis protein
MNISSGSHPACDPPKALGLARVLLVHGELAPRLTLQTILEAGGYAVDVAANPEGALSKLDENKYELVLSDEDFGHRPAGRDILAYARVKAYRPATALVTYDEPVPRRKSGRSPHCVSIHTDDVPELLERVAELIGRRASRRYRPVRATV